MPSCAVSEKTRVPSTTRDGARGGIASSFVNSTSSTGVTDPGTRAQPASASSGTASATRRTADRRALAALGPKVLQLAGARTAGALPYLTTPEHTREARRILGGGVLLAPEQMVVLETDTDIARATARDRLGPYLQLSNYAASFQRLGFGADDFADGGSDRLVDAMVLHGSAVEVAEGLKAHLEAGADHVAIQLLGHEGIDLLPGYEALATVLG